ncbi:MAG: hypothetical protein WA252_07560 [Candidatus Sulfotelmatobacter sp.]
METIVGIFHSVGEAEDAVDDLIKRDIPQEALALLSREKPQKYTVPVKGEEHLDKLPDPGTKAVGAGKATGEVLGVTIGGSAGFALAATAAALTVPGLGIVFAIGLGGAALAGLGGAAAGAKVGHSMGGAVDEGVPKEQVELYHRFLQKGYSLVIADVRSGADISTVREVFRNHGSEEVEKARRELGEAA